MVRIDGSRGEGGGQVLRSALALSLITQKPFRIDAIRARRKRPGLRRQHLAAVRAARDVCGASVTGDSLGSRALTFTPGPVRGGDYTFSIGTAGSTGLVLQTVLPALALCGDESTIELRGGTHNPLAPPFDFLERTLCPLLERMGPRVEATLHQPGFYPAGGGLAVFRVRPADRLRPLVLLERGAVRRRAIRALVANLPGHIGDREVAAIADRLGWDRGLGEVTRVRSAGPGNAVTVDVESEALTEVFTGFGERGVRAEKVGERVAAEVAQYLDAGVPVGKHLADQLLLWLALAGGGAFRTVEPTGHTRTQAEILRIFLDVEVTIEQDKTGWEIRVARSDSPRSCGTEA